MNCRFGRAADAAFKRAERAKMSASTVEEEAWTREGV